MAGLHRLRRRVPFVVFVLLLVVALLVLGFVCVCMSDHPVQALERALAAIPVAAPTTSVEFAALAALTVATMGATRLRYAPDRASPAALQRFLF